MRTDMMAAGSGCAGWSHADDVRVLSNATPKPPPRRFERDLRACRRHPGPSLFVIGFGFLRSPRIDSFEPHQRACRRDPTPTGVCTTPTKTAQPNRLSCFVVSCENGQGLQHGDSRFYNVVSALPIATGYHTSLTHDTPAFSNGKGGPFSAYRRRRAQPIKYSFSDRTN